MKTPHYIILAILLLLSGWIGYLLKTCPDEYPPEIVYMQDTRKIDSLTKVIASQKVELVLYHDSTSTFKVQLKSKRERVKEVLIENPCPEVEQIVAESDSACDAVIESQGKELAISAIIIEAQDSVIKEGIDLRMRDSAEIAHNQIELFKADKKIKRKNTWLKCGAAIFVADLIRRGIMAVAKK